MTKELLRKEKLLMRKNIKNKEKRTLVLYNAKVL